MIEFEKADKRISGNNTAASRLERLYIYTEERKQLLNAFQEVLEERQVLNMKSVAKDKDFKKVINTTINYYFKLGNKEV